MDHRPQAWGRPRDDVYGAYDPSYFQGSGPKQATQSPIVTGTSVIAIKFKDGVVMAADNLASYGSLARFTDVSRLRSFDGTSVLGFGGDISDMQHLDRHLTGEEIALGYDKEGDSSSPSTSGGLNAANLYTFLSKSLYNKRSKFDPLWLQVLIAGFDSDSTPFLGSIDLKGLAFTGPSLATGFGASLAQPYMRKFTNDEESVAAKLTLDEAVDIVKESMKTLYYRDGRAYEYYDLAIVTKEGVKISERQKLGEQSWAFADKIKGYGTQTE